MSAKKLAAKVDEIAGTCIAVRLRMLNRVITNLYDDALRPWGVKVSQMNILVATEKFGIGRPAEICEALQLDVSTLSRNVERMKARGWLEAVPDEDGRAQPFHLTATGKELLVEAAPGWKEAQRQAEAILGDAMVGQLDRAVRRSRKYAS